MKIKKLLGPPQKRLGDLKNGDLFERADVETPCTTYMVCRHDSSICEVGVAARIDGSCTYVVDLKNAVYKAMDDDTPTIPLEQDNEIVVREL